MLAAVTDDPRAAPTPNVPAVEAENVPMYVMAVEPAVVKVSADEFVFVPLEAAFHEHDWRV
jgi:hypothetical protein